MCQRYELEKTFLPASIDDASITLVTSDPFRSVVAGRISLSAHKRPAQLRFCTRPPHCRYNPGFGCVDIFDHGYNSLGLRSTSGTFLLILSQRECLISCTESEDQRRTPYRESKLFGLIHETASENPVTYKRVGMFVHPWGHYWNEEGLKAYPEFSDFDPDNFERQLVTIV